MSKRGNQGKTSAKRQRERCVEDFSLERLVIEGGHGARQITLPADWAREVGLQKHNAKVRLVCFKNDNQFLSVVPSGTPSGKGDAIIQGAWQEQEQEVSELVCRQLIRKVLAAYLVGFQKIYVKDDSGVLPKELEDRVVRFFNEKIKFADVQASPGVVVVEAPNVSFSIESSIRRMHEKSKEMHINAVDLISHFNREAAENILRADDEVDALSHGMVRFCKLAGQNPSLVKESGLRNYRDLMGFRVIAKSVERTADHACRIATNLQSLHDKEGAIKLDSHSKQTIMTCRDRVVRAFKDAVDALFAKSRNYDMADKVIENVDGIVDSLEEELSLKAAETATAEELYCKRRILESLKRTAEYTRTIAEVVCNMYVESVLNRQPSVS